MTKRSTIYIRKSNAIKTSAIGLTALLCSACGAESTDNEAEHPPPSTLIITHDDDTGTSYKSPVQTLKDDIKTQEEDDKAVAKKYRKEADRRSEQKAEINSIKKDAEKDVKQAHDKARKQAEEYERKIERLKSERDELKRQQSSVKPPKETKEVAHVERMKNMHNESKRKVSDTKGQTFNTSYYGMDCAGCTGITASGLDVSGGQTHYNGMRILAADTSILPLHTVVKVTNPDGSSYTGIVKDRGGAIKGQKLDILVGSEAESKKRGRHVTKVEVIKRGDNSYRRE